MIELAEGGFYYSVCKFNKVYGLTVEGKDLPIEEIPLKLRKLRQSLIVEEQGEVQKAFALKDVPNLIKELCDLIYVLVGIPIVYGFNKKEFLLNKFNIFFDSSYHNFNCKNDILDLYSLNNSDFFKSANTLNYIVNSINTYLLGEALNNKDRILYSIIECLNNIGFISFAYNIPIYAPFNEVQASNMSKLGEDGKPIYNEIGKVMKGPNYFEADINKFIK